MGLFDLGKSTDEFEEIESGERLIADYSPDGDQQRGLVDLQATDSASGGAVPVATSEGQEIGAIQTDQFSQDSKEASTGFLAPQGRGRSSASGDVLDVTRNANERIDPIAIKRDNKSGKFAHPDFKTEADQSVPADRGPEGRFVPKDPEPITDIGRDPADGLFDRF